MTVLLETKTGKTCCKRHTPVSLYGRCLEFRYLKQVVVDKVVVTDTALPTVVQSVAHTASTVIVANCIATDGVLFTVETTDATFVYICNHTRHVSVVVVLLCQLLHLL